MPRVAFDTSTALVNEARALRARRKEDQATFWGRVGIRQSVGCRIERSRRISPYAAILLRLRLQGELDDGQLDALTHAVQGTAVDRERDALVRLALCSPGTYRRRLGEQQAVFWGRVGITQSGGSRLEAGQAMPAPVQMMLAGLVLGVIEPSSLEAVQRRSDGKRPALRVGTKLPTELWKSDWIRGRHSRHLSDCPAASKCGGCPSQPGYTVIASGNRDLARRRCPLASWRKAG